MILTVDVGNTNIVVGCCDGEQIIFTSRLATNNEKMEDEYAIFLHNLLNLHGINLADISGAIIGSVVPPMVNILKRAISILIGRPPLVVGPGVKTGLNIRIDNPAQLGSDMVANAVAAINEYTAPLVVINLGTATTFSLIDNKRNYVGGVIYPGVSLSMAALSSGTSQLPHIALDPPPAVVGRNTIDSMKSGAIFGSASMIDGMVSRIEKWNGEPCQVVATGALAESVVPHCQRPIVIDTMLTMKGLRLIYKKNQPENHA